MRTFAIGDIHGHQRALRGLLDRVAPQTGDRLIFLGDYVDKGPNVKGVIDDLLSLGEVHDAIFLRGNHDQMLIDAYRDPVKVSIWECLGGEDPLASYGRGSNSTLLGMVPAEHWAFLETRCRNYFETPDFIFVHGGIRPQMAPSEEDPERLQWTTLSLAERHLSGRTVICGHSAQRSGHITDLGHTICLDTNITAGGWLTCLSLDDFEYWQADSDGQTRFGHLREPTQ
jgi:serine/threonine protein phosphatase 1